MQSTKYPSCSTQIPLLPTLFCASGDDLYRRRALKAPNIIIYQFTAMDKWVQPGDGLISLWSRLSPTHWFLDSTSQLLTLTNTQRNRANLYSNTLSAHLSFFCSSLPKKLFNSGYQDSKLIPKLNDMVVDSGQFSVAARRLARAPSGLLWSSAL